MAALAKLRPQLRTVFLHVPARLSARAFNGNLPELARLQRLQRLALVLPEVHDAPLSRTRRQPNLRAVSSLTTLTQLQVGCPRTDC